ncbi:hypothetical protein HK097_004598 [Rhizophlyctis rosea]|uniref:RRM domain-containing protein n=1 Tax=Rhizophlyctis rosea TaxID=64517 RepID=A0AAD5SKJ1_9FUNG|nr:hypothetical protein HK097_004598 [Rhizophlyctis rosea]
MSYYTEDPNAAYYGQQYDQSYYGQDAYAAGGYNDGTHYDPNIYSADPQSTYTSTYSAQPTPAAAAPPTSYTSYGASSVSYAGPVLPSTSSHDATSASDGVPYPAGYTVTSEEGAAPYPEGYTPSAASAKVITIGAEERKAAAVAALPSVSGPNIVSGNYGTPGAAAAAAKEGKGKKKKNVVRAAGGEVWEDPTLAEWDDSDFRMFCGDLGNEVNDDLLLKAFSKYSSVQRARVVRDKRTSKSKGYGFVSFKDPNEFVKALREMNGKYVGNRPIKLRKSTWDERNADLRSLRKTVGGSVVKIKKT